MSIEDLMSMTDEEFDLALNQVTIEAIINNQ